MCVDNWRNSKLSSQYNYFSICAQKGKKGRPSGGFLFGWKKYYDIIVIDKNSNFVQLLIPTKNVYIFIVYV